MGPVTPALGGAVRVKWQTIWGTYVVQGLAPSLGQWSSDGEPGSGLQSCPSSQVPGPGKAGHAGTTCWKAGGLCLHPCPSATPELGGTSTQGWEMADRACCLMGLWEGSQWFAKNSPKSWLCLPVGSRAPPWSRAKELADGPFMFPVTGTQMGMGLEAAGWVQREGGGTAALPRSLAGT